MRRSGIIHRVRGAGPRAVWLGVIVVAVLVLAASIVLSRLREDVPVPTDEPAVMIQTPRDGETVDAGEPIPVEADATGSSLTKGGHLHVSVDGELVDMPSSNVTTVTLSPGRHEITVEYTNAFHASFDPPLEASVQVVAE